MDEERDVVPTDEEVKRAEEFSATLHAIHRIRDDGEADFDDADVEKAEEYSNLLSGIAQLSEKNYPNDSDTERLNEFLTKLKAIEELSDNWPSKADMERAEDYLTTLKAIKELHDEGHAPSE